MKKTLTLIAVIFTAVTFASATQKVMMHSNGQVSEFSGFNPLVAAYDSAKSGDTIYLSGGVFAAPAIFNKRLFIYGAGYHLDSTLATNPTQISGNFNLGENSDNSIFEGVQIANRVEIGNNVSASYITFKRCKFNNHIQYQGDGSTNPSVNNAFIECVIIGELYLNNLTSSNFQNCFIQKTIADSRANQFKNSVFLHNQPDNYHGGVLHRPYYNEFSNNIFLNPGYRFIYDHHDGNIFNHNIFVYSAPGYGNNAISNGNFTGVAHADIFVNQSGYVFNFNHDYHLKTPGNFVGNDGKEVGLYGGTFPLKAGGVPANPHISKKVILGTTDHKGDLEVEIEVSAQNH